MFDTKINRAYGRPVATASPAKSAFGDFARRVAVAAATADGAELRRLRAELARTSRSASAGHARGLYDGLLSVVDAAADFVGDGRGLAPQSAPLEPGSLAARLLLEIAGGVRGANADLADRLDTDQSQLSRAGRRLREVGLVDRTRAGRLNVWTLTAAGGRAAARLRGGLA